MSLSPPVSPQIGDVWVDPFTAERYVFSGVGEFYSPSGLHLDALDGWERWDLRNEQYEYEREK